MFRILCSLIFCFGYVGNVFSLSVDIVDNKILLGHVNGKLATNYSNGKFMKLEWLSLSGEIVSNKPYLIPDNSLGEVRFCVTLGAELNCSTVLLTSKNQAVTSISNSANITVDIDNSSDLVTGGEAVATSHFSVISGDIGFHYTEIVDQSGYVLTNSISDNDSLISLSLPFIKRGITSLKACSVGGFSFGNPPFIETCTLDYKVQYFPDIDYCS